MKKVYAIVFIGFVFLSCNTKKQIEAGTHVEEKGLKTETLSNGFFESVSKITVDSIEYIIVRRVTSNGDAVAIIKHRDLHNANR